MSLLKEINLSINKLSTICLSNYYNDSTKKDNDLIPL